MLQGVNVHLYAECLPCIGCGDNALSNILVLCCVLKTSVLVERNTVILRSDMLLIVMTVIETCVADPPEGWQGYGNGYLPGIAGYSMTMQPISSKSYHCLAPLYC